MKELLWKDYRLNRPVIILGAAVLLLFYTLGAVMEVQASWPRVPPAGAWAEMLVAYGTAALYLALCITGILGGNAIAGERADRSAHFLAYLPPTRWQIVASKLAIAAGATAAAWAWILLSVYVVAPLLNRETSGFLGTVSGGAAAAGCVLTFGVGWLASAHLERPLVPCVLALASPVVLSFVLLTVAAVCGIPRFEIADWSAPVCLAAGVAAFAAGTWAYVRRVEP